MRPQLFCHALLALSAALGPLFEATAQPPDQPVKVTHRYEPNYPGPALTRGISQGYAKVYFWVDEIGRASDYVVVAHNGEWFGDALLKALPNWHFEPKIENGGPVGSVYSVEWHFHPDQAVQLNVMQAADKKFKKGEVRDEVKVLPVDPAELDSPLALQEVYPIYVDKKDFDRVVLDVEFFVDETGAVRLPRLLSGGDARDKAALERFRKWKFEQPTKNGEPVPVSLHKTIVVPVVETGP